MRKITQKILAVVITITLPTATVQIAHATPKDANAISQEKISAEELDHVLEVLEQLPDDLKYADPQVTQNYEERLAGEIRKIEVGESGTSFRTNWGLCALEVAKFIGEYGIPVFKVISWLKQLKKLHGSMKNVITSIIDGRAYTEVGEEGAEVLLALTGIPSVVEACS